MFQTLQPLIAACGEIRMTLIDGGNGVIKVAVTPTRKPNSDAALSQPLLLTATAADLDEGFIAAIASFNKTRASLVEQVEATNTVLKAAEKSQADKATKKLSTKPTTAAKPVAPASSNDADDEDDNNEEGNDDNVTGSSNDTTPPPVAAPVVQMAAGTDLSSLF